MREPTTTVVIPTRNRPVQLARCLDALSASKEPPGGLEIVVVDDGGDSDLERFLARAAPHEARLERVAWGGPAAARNAGVAVARGEVILFTDDDCRPAPRWALELSEAIRGDAQPVLAGGRTCNALASNPCASASQLVLDLAYEYHGGFERPSFFASNNLGVRREAFAELGGFDPNFRTSEDRDLCDRWRLRGWTLRGVPEAVVHHAHDLDLARFLRQHFSYGRGAYRLGRARARRGSPLALLDPRFHLLVMRTSLRRARAAGGRAELVLPLLLLWQLANAAGFVASAARGDSISRA